LKTALPESPLIFTNSVNSSRKIFAKMARREMSKGVNCSLGIGEEGDDDAAPVYEG
jgi:hypothetical protein